jgi:subtilase family serine protease
MKLGLQGVTILYSSGDYGVASNTGQCCTNAGCAGDTFNAPGAGGSFVPSFPSTCPYVTSVGVSEARIRRDLTSLSNTRELKRITGNSDCSRGGYYRSRRGFRDRDLLRWRIQQCLPYAKLSSFGAESILQE